MMKTTSLFALLAFTVGCLAPDTRAAPKAKSFQELGRVQWHRDEQKALAQARSSGKPLMVFSTELPGCGSCKKFGSQYLSHPLVVDAASAFVPLVLVDARTWPTMFFRTADGKELIRKIGYSRRIGPLVDGMERALQAAKRPVPLYLKLAAAEYRCRKPQKATFGMGCFWTGEASLGGIDGVISSRCGFLSGEVVELTFDPKVISYRALVQEARKLSCASFVVARTDEQAKIAQEVIDATKTPAKRPRGRVIRSNADIRAAKKDTKYRLRRHRPYFLLPLTELQACKLNAAVAVRGRKPEAYLSPTQLALLQQLKQLSAEQIKGLKLEPVRSGNAIGAYAAVLRLKLTGFAARADASAK